MSMGDNILTGVVNAISTLGLSFTSGTIPVVKRKGVKKEPSVDSSTQITVSMNTEEVTYIAFGQISVTYPVEVTIVTPNERDWATNLSIYLTWREEIRGLFQPPALTSQSPLLGVNGVWDVRVRPDTFLDREAMAKNYDDMALIIYVKGTS